MIHKRMTYLTDGVQTSFRFPFQVDQGNDLRVFTVDPLDLEYVPLFLVGDYSVTGIGVDEGGTIELTTDGLKKAAEGLKLVIKKGPAYEGGGQPAQAGFDRSYEEQWTGGYDRTDGDRKIYSKTIDCGSAASVGIFNTPLNIPNLRNVWIVEGWGLGVFNGGSSVYALPHAANANDPIRATINMDLKAVRIWTHIARTSLHCYVTVKYTKNE